MSDIIDFKIEKINREHDDNTKMKMPDGTFWYKYSCEYTFEKGDKGQGIPEELLRASSVVFPKNKWSIEFWALNDDDAQKRINAMKDTFEEPMRIVSQGI